MKHVPLGDLRSSRICDHRLHVIVHADVSSMKGTRAATRRNTSIVYPLYSVGGRAGSHTTVGADGATHMRSLPWMLCLSSGDIDAAAAAASCTRNASASLCRRSR